MAVLRDWLRRFTQSDEDRLAEEVRAWAEGVPGTVRISECRARQRARVAGAVRRLTLRPLEGKESLSVVVHDGTGELTAVWTGREQIPGLQLGTRLILEGLVAEERGGLRMVNPSFEFA